LANQTQSSRRRLSVVSYLNTVPLIWGLQHKPELKDIFDLNFAVPSACADQLASGAADIGIVPVIEMARQKLDYFRETGISCHGPVRSILLTSKVPFHRIKTLATDSGSRTSVMLARMILAEKFGVEPELISHAPLLEPMLTIADAALIIGDAALHLEPAQLPYATLDLGEEWTNLTQLPFVFAVWSGKKEVMRRAYADALLASCKYGQSHTEAIVEQEAPKRNLPEALVREYFTRYIKFELDEKAHQGLELYLKNAAQFERTLFSGATL
jgi:chorismate dehydratase